MPIEDSPMWPRRTFIRNSTLAIAGAAITPVCLGDTTAEEIKQGEDDHPPSAPQDDAAQIRVLLHEADGSPLDKVRRTTLHARDMANDALPQPMASAEGRARIVLAKEPIQLSCRLQVPGFGEVYCYADNKGRGYTKAGTVEFVVEAATTRWHRVREAAKAAKHAGVASDPELDSRLSAAGQPLPSQPEKARIAAAYDRLAHGLHAGERLSVIWARHRIARLSAPRTEFLFGALGSGWQRGGDWEKRFVEAFNFATVSWYSWKNENPVDQRIDYWRMDNSVQWCLDHKITPKGFGYVYLTPGATPEWFRSWPYEKVLPEYKRIVEMTMRRFDGRVPYVEVINEAHDKANLFHFSHEQIVNLAKEACRAARAGSPTVKRQMNHCCLWAEYAKRPEANGVRRWSPFRYVSDCIKGGVEFEVIGLQMYYPQQDLFEIERMVDRFTVFGKRLHITEIGCHSADGLDAESMRPKNVVPGWHGPWTESMQADWLEGLYTICYSKPQFEAIEWWDLSDTPGHFWPFGGLLRKDLTPKQSYLRLLDLQKKWGVAKNVA